ncbi:hypothetical protein K504DRAFT_463420 [Pleomassaria siparia CBS 279.74]|uniref:T6SS Phospholipase effector Tle1-like catalytic domain-containing protein n=1 Tax=Pleomassaria siparia CBS 279.74 TaxID=1314801 RepID=A0A6G1JTW7_9PLEO|nr:hypothetical protein K504DRAFT_463420 [Pleomassaria siparia CBS 279.74]
MAVGSGLGIHIKDAYRFLMQNYREGDKICLFGFSRGAYTVRCLAGMLHKVGLLPASNTAQVNFAYDFYKDNTTEGWTMSAEFKKTFCTNVQVYFVGLWDCVASVGFIPRKLPFSSSPTNSIHYFRHAMALDEHRSKFKVCHWQQQDPDLQRRKTLDNTPKAQAHRLFRGKKKEVDAAVLTNALEKGKAAFENGNSHILDTHDVSEQDKLEAYFDAYDATRKRHEKVETNGLEVWCKLFLETHHSRPRIKERVTNTTKLCCICQRALLMSRSSSLEYRNLQRSPIVKNRADLVPPHLVMGAHADIGGGAVPNETRHMLSRIPFRWMVRQCFECDTGILFDTVSLVEQGLDMDSLYPMWKPHPVPSHSPPPTLVKTYESKKLPPLSWRSAFLPLDEKDSENGMANGRTTHHSAVLPESAESHFDALAPVNDMLTIAKGWWVLEYWPVKIRVLTKDEDGWEKRVRMNRGRYRAVRESEPKMHWTVKRMIDEGRYTLKGRCRPGTNWQVVS